MLPLPITPADALLHIVGPALALLKPHLDTPVARVLLLTIGLQESGLKARRQFDNGPARGLLQFERTGGVKGVLEHRASRLAALLVCEARGVAPLDEEVHEALERDDILAFAFGRLLLWTDPKPLPALGDVDGGLALYLRTWRPGRPRVGHWAGNYAAALAALEDPCQKLAPSTRKA